MCLKVKEKDSKRWTIVGLDTFYPSEFATYRPSTVMSTGHPSQSCKPLLYLTQMTNNVPVTMNCPITISVKVMPSTKIPSCSINNFINCGLVSTQG